MPPPTPPPIPPAKPPPKGPARAGVTIKAALVKIVTAIALRKVIRMIVSFDGGSCRGPPFPGCRKRTSRKRIFSDESEIPRQIRSGDCKMARVLVRVWRFLDQAVAASR
jgi:hypothetical protein